MLYLYQDKKRKGSGQRAAGKVKDMMRYWYKGEEREVSEEVAEKAMREFEKRFLDEEDLEEWEEAKEEGFDEANGFASEKYNVNLEQFF